MIDGFSLQKSFEQRYISIHENIMTIWSFNYSLFWVLKLVMFFVDHLFRDWGQIS